MAADDSYTTNTDIALIVAASGVLLNDTDVDAGDARTAVLAPGGTPAGIVGRLIP